MLRKAGYMLKTIV